MASANGPGTSWEAPKKHLPPPESKPAPAPAPAPAGGIDKKRRKIYYFISVVLMVIGLVIVGLFILPFARGFWNMAGSWNTEALRMAYLRDTVNAGVAALIGALVTYGGYKLFHLTWHPKPDTFPLKPSKPGQVLKPGE
jgi:hypothetical protein